MIWNRRFVRLLESRGEYSHPFRGVRHTSGVGLVEAHDLGPAASQLANISTHAFVVLRGQRQRIGGFILGVKARIESDRTWKSVPHW